MRNEQDYKRIYRSIRKQIHQELKQKGVWGMSTEEPIITKEEPNKKRRRAHDQYFTPIKAVETLLKNINIHPNETVFDPCAGDGDILNTIYPLTGCIPIGNDLFVQKVKWLQEDATNPNTFIKALPVYRDLFDWVITNPPYNNIMPILENSLDRALKVVMLLRISFLEPCNNRVELLQKHPPTKIIFLPRISFTGDGKTDNVATAWFVWERDSFSTKLFFEGRE
jgi:DNA modification methylase